MSINFDLDDLSAFIAVMELGNFHEASARLNLSQPAVSRRIQKLELALGTSLFTRTTRSVVPTLAAKRLQARAESLLDDAADIARSLRDESIEFAYQSQAIVTVACVPSMVAGIFPGALKRLKQKGIQLRIRFIDTSANEAAIAVSNGEADFGICSLPLLEPNAVFQPLFEENIVLAMAEDHYLAKKKEIELADLIKERLILPARGTGNRLLIDEILAQADLRLRWSYEVNRTTTALELVAGGVGISFVPRSSVDGAAALPVLWRRVANMEILRPVGILTRRGKVQSQSTIALMELVTEVARSDIS